MVDDINSMSLTALRKEVKSLTDAIFDVGREAWSTPDAIKAKKALDEAQKAYGEIIERAKDELVKPLDARMTEVKRRIDEIETEREAQAPVTPAHIQKAFGIFKLGTDYGPKPFQCKWVSPTGRFFIMTRPGHCFWASMMEPKKYAKSEHYLMDCAKIPWGSKRIHGHDIYMAARVGCVNGRLAKGTMAEWMQLALETEKKEPDAFRLPKDEV